MKYDVFISCRREYGDQIAKTIYDRLKEKGYNVYLDVESLHSGAFNEKLYTIIDECRDVLVILSPGALDGCVNGDDWVRLEVAHAIQGKKNIIPVMLRGFAFPSELPADIEVLRYQSGVQASLEFFDAFMKKLDHFLNSKPGLIHRFFNYLSWRRALITVGAFIFLLLAIWGGSIPIKNIIMKVTVYPASQKEKNDVRNMLYYVQTNLMVADNMLSIYQDALTDCENDLYEFTASSYSDLVTRLRQTRELLEKERQQIMPLSKDLSNAFSKTKINAAKLAALSQFVASLYLEYDQAVIDLETEMNPVQRLNKDDQYRLISIGRELANLDAQSLVVKVCQLSLPIDEKALQVFRTDHLPLLGEISKELYLWSRDETDLTSKEKNITLQQQSLRTEYASFIGNKNSEAHLEKNPLSELTASPSGADPITAKKKEIAEKEKKLAEKKKELAEIQKRTAAAKQSIREKFAPKDTDEPSLLWGKALRFLRVKMYDEAVNVFQFYLNKVKDTDTEAKVYVPAAINFVKNIDKTGINYGLLAIGYEPGKPPHPVFRVGDILVAVNKTIIRNFNDYERIGKSIPANSTYEATILRPDETGVLRTIDVEIPRGVTRVAFMNLEETE